MSKVFVRGIRLFGKLPLPSDEFWDDSNPKPDIRDVGDSYENIELFLSKHAREVVPLQIENFPYMYEGMVTSPNAGSIYIYNNCLVANIFTSGSGFNLGRVFQTLISAGFSEINVKDILSSIKQSSGYSSTYSFDLSERWEDDFRLSKEIEFPERISDIRKILDYNSTG